MEVVALPFSPDQTISPYKQQIRRKPRRNVQTTVPRPCENFSPANLLFLEPPPYLSSSLSVFISNTQKQRQSLPPLLPLPINNKPRSQNRGPSSPPTNRKTNRTRDHDQTPKKPKPSSSSTPKKLDSRSISAESLMINRLGPEPCDLPEEVLMRVMKPSVAFEDKKEVEEKFSGSSVFYLSPHPSSLPLPKFSVRPKLSCNAEAGGIDAGATDNLRRLLRLL